CAESVALISGVSGGAVGSMYYMNLFDPKREKVFDRDALNELMEKASVSSLDEIGWGLVYRDFPRIFFPYLNQLSGGELLDRGYMLEESWRSKAQINANLSEWRNGITEGLRPAVIFNSTIAETGEPLVFASTEIKGKGKGETFAIKSGEKEERFGRKSFYDLH